MICKVDGQIAVNAQRLSRIDQTLIKNHIETYSAALPYFEIDLCQCESLIETLNESIYFDFQTAAAISPIECFVLACDYTPDQLARSQSAFQADYAARFHRKTQTGKSRPLSVL